MAEKRSYFFLLTNTSFVCLFFNFFFFTSLRSFLSLSLFSYLRYSQLCHVTMYLNNRPPLEYRHVNQCITIHHDVVFVKENGIPRVSFFLIFAAFSLL